ncbi:MAG: WD40/YVTN/BNR-like repeat-containing protein, partial [Candidatus Aminicenantales bacterium]
HDEAVAYIVKTGFQRDDYRPFLFKTEDFGETWRSITGDLPEGTVHVIVEDRKNPALLFVGKEFGVWVTIDGGQRWVKMTGNMPTQDVFDLLIHPRENDLVVGTYGRGIYVTDISPLQELSYEMLEKDVHLFEIEPRIQWRYRPRGRIFGHRQFRAPNEPNGMMVHYYLKNNLPEDVKVMITDPYGKQAARLKGPGRAGIHRIVWDMRQQPPEEESREEAGIRRSRRGRGEFVEPGEYVVILEAGGKRLQQRAVIRPMPLH